MSDVHDEHGLVISGIDGSTPLGFLSALGLLLVVEGAGAERGLVPRLSWKQLDAWRPVLYGCGSITRLAEMVYADSQHWDDAALLAFRYVKQEKQGPKAVGGLKAPLAAVRVWLSARRDAEDEESLAYGAALFCDGVTEINKKPATAEDHRRLAIPIDLDRKSHLYHPCKLNAVCLIC